MIGRTITASGDRIKKQEGRVGSLPPLLPLIPFSAFLLLSRILKTS